MAEKKLGDATLRFADPPPILQTATVVGPLEGQGPLADTFDIIYEDQMHGEKSFEACERAMMKDAVQAVFTKANMQAHQADLMLAGDLLNQIITSSFAARDIGLPFVGLYAACSGMAIGLGMAATIIDGGYADRIVSAVSSHYGASERQFRYPTEYGGQKPPFAQSTVNASGAALVVSPSHASGLLPRVTHFTVGRIVDRGIKDPFDMGVAMAPAAADTLQRHFRDTGRRPDYYDLILTGDLAAFGKDVLLELMLQAGLDLHANYDDCGCRIYDRDKQPVFAGGSGCGCSAAVTYGSIMQQLRAGKLQRVLVAATGALLSPTSYQQGETIPCVAHAVSIEMLADRGEQ